MTADVESADHRFLRKIPSLEKLSIPSTFHRECLEESSASLTRLAVARQLDAVTAALPSTPSPVVCQPYFAPSSSSSSCSIWDHFYLT